MASSVSKMLVFQIETCLYCAVLTASCCFASNYFTFLKIPAIVFMCVYAVFWMLVVHIIVMLSVFSLRSRPTAGVFMDSVVADVSQGFAVVASILWVSLLSGMYLHLPYITATPGGESSASAVALAVVLGFFVVVPFLALISTYMAVPDGATNSLLINGSTLGAASLLFLVFVSFGSTGFTRCYLFGGGANNSLFIFLVVIYWGLLFGVEIADEFWDPLELWGGAQAVEGTVQAPRGFLAKVQSLNVSVRISYCRIVGCLLDIMIVATSIAFSNSDIHGTTGLFILFITLVHIPLVVMLEFATPEKSTPVAVVLPKVEPFTPPGSKPGGSASGSRIPNMHAFPFNAAASSGINSRVTPTLPRQRRGLSTESDLFY